MEIVNGFKSCALPEQDPELAEALSRTRTITAKEFLDKGTLAAIIHGMGRTDAADYLTTFAALIFSEGD